MARLGYVEKVIKFPITMHVKGNILCCFSGNIKSQTVIVMKLRFITDTLGDIINNNY